MNLLEHYIKEVVSVEEVPEHQFKDSNGNIQTIKTYWKMTYIVDCYGNVREYTKTYFNQEEIGIDLDRGYFLA